MNKLILKVAVGFSTLATGIAVVWASGIALVSSPSPANLSLPVSETPATRQLIRGNSGKVPVHFKGFEYGKGWLADFEIINETAHPIYYVGSKRKYKFDYCTLAAKHKEKYENLSFDIRSSCRHSTGMFLQSLQPGESLVLAVWEHEVRQLLHITDAKLDTKAQIGFEFFTGEEKRREMLWSEETTFPYDDPR
jgi:hypothetical protein